MDINSLEIKTKANYNWDDIVYINDFDADSLEIIKSESKIGFNIYYIEYNTIKPFYFVLSSLRNKNITIVVDKIWGLLKIKLILILK